MRNSKLLTVLYMMCHLCGHGFEAQLSFQDLGVTGALSLSLPSNNDISDGPFTVPGGGIPYLITENATDIYISDNGLISLNGPFVDPPEQGSDFSAVDGEGVVIIAPYWSDNDIRLSGFITYEEYTSTHQLLAVRDKLAEVSALLSSVTGTAFSGAWMFLVEWENCSSFPAGSNPIDPSINATFLSYTNKYQAIVITDSVSQSYAIFIYECNEIEWSGLNSTFPRVGISNGMGRSYTHPSSGSASIADIDCENVNPGSNIVNIGLDLTTFAPLVRVSAINSSISLSSVVSDSVSSSDIAVLSTPSQTQSPLVPISVSSSNIAVLSTPSPTLAQLSASSTTSMAILQGNQLQATVSVFPLPSSIQNDTPTVVGIVNNLVPVHVIVVPIVVLLLTLIASLIVIFVCFYMYHKKTVKVGPEDTQTAAIVE